MTNEMKPADLRSLQTHIHDANGEIARITRDLDLCGEELLRDAKWRRNRMLVRWLRATR
jgi:hypothetical protein